jgi:hypothetical protein
MFACGDARLPARFASRLAPTKDKNGLFSFGAGMSAKLCTMKRWPPLSEIQKSNKQSSDRMII